MWGRPTNGRMHQNQAVGAREGREVFWSHPNKWAEVWETHDMEKTKESFLAVKKLGEEARNDGTGTNLYVDDPTLIRKVGVRRPSGQLNNTKLSFDLSINFRLHHRNLFFYTP